MGHPTFAEFAVMVGYMLGAVLLILAALGAVFMAVTVGIMFAGRWFMPTIERWGERIDVRREKPATTEEL